MKKVSKRFNRFGFSLFFLSMFLFASTLALSGCGGVQVKQSSLQENRKVSFILPDNHNIVGFNSFLKGLTYGGDVNCSPWLTAKNTGINGFVSSCEGNGVNFVSNGILDVKGIQVKYNSGGIVVTQFNGEEFIPSSLMTSFIQYYINVNAIKQNNNYIVVMRPVKRKLGYGKNPLGFGYPMPNFTEEQLIRFLKKPDITIRFKANYTSKYNSFSTNANFARLLKEKTFKKSKKITGRIFKIYYILPLMNNEYQAKVFVRVYPYQNGSMAIVRVLIPIRVNSNTSDLTFVNTLIARAKQKIKQIVQS